MASRNDWTRQQLLVAFALYCRLPFGRLHRRNPEIVRFAEAIGRTPSALAMKLTNIASLDPEITSTGRAGLRGASAQDRAMWNEMHTDWEQFALATQQAIAEITSEQVFDETYDPIDERIGKDRTVQTTVRIGQNFFRRTILSAYNEQCCITGLSIPALLVASHIIPWRTDKLNRVNSKNGLCLSALHDKAFDSGLITINEDMTVQISKTHPVKNDPFFSESIEAYVGKPISLPEKFSPDKNFLAYHREYIFQK